jgi:formylmethanofuran dehydrogenase subunit D
MAEGRELTVVTFRGIFQEVQEALGIYSDGYRDESAVVFLDGGDASGLDVEAGSPVRMETDYGAVVVAAKISEDPHPGVAFMPKSPWSSQLLSGDTGERGVLEMKRFTARVSSSDEGPTSIAEIGEMIRGG